MGHSIQVIGDKSAIINDGDLLVVMGLSLAAIRHSGQYASLTDLTQKWQKALDGYGPGVIDLKLERIFENPKSKAELKSVFDVVSRQVDRCGEKIPADLLNEFVRVQGVTFFDYDTVSIREALMKLGTLID